MSFLSHNDVCFGLNSQTWADAVFVYNGEGGEDPRVVLFIKVLLNCAYPGCPIHNIYIAQSQLGRLTFYRFPRFELLYIIMRQQAAIFQSPLILPTSTSCSYQTISWSLKIKDQCGGLVLLSIFVSSSGIVFDVHSRTLRLTCAKYKWKKASLIIKSLLIKYSWDCILFL